MWYFGFISISFEKIMFYTEILTWKVELWIFSLVFFTTSKGSLLECFFFKDVCSDCFFIPIPKWYQITHSVIVQKIISFFIISYIHWKKYSKIKTVTFSHRFYHIPLKPFEDWNKSNCRVHHGQLLDLLKQAPSV